MTDDPQRWLHQTPMTDPGRQTFLLDGLPDGLRDLCRMVQGLLIHLEWTAAYGLSPRDLVAPSRDTLSVADRLRQLAEVDRRPLRLQRPPKARSPGTCRDFALMLCGLLRHQGIPARVRCGFAAYFAKGHWEDHWICEGWLASEQRWLRIDPQLDSVLVQRLEIAFDPTDIAPSIFMSAGEAWLCCRAGRDDAKSFGHGTSCGPWFMHINVMRDHLVLNGSEVSAWDSWRNASAEHHLLSDDELRVADVVAAHPMQATRMIAPPWSR